MSGAVTARVGIRNPPPSGGATVTLHPGAISANTPFGFASLSFARDGVETHSAPGGSGTTVYDWVSPKDSTVGDAYEVRATLNSGALASSSATSTWLQLNSTRAWNVNPASEDGIGSANLTIEIRPFGGGSVLASGTYTLDNPA